VSLVSHSLGVTIARKAMFVRPDLAARVDAFVGIAGGNHGTTFCPPGSEGNVHSCDEIAAGTPWLEELNGPDGSLETYGDTRWLTIYDGTGSGDVAYVGPDYAKSPVLKGADNREFPGTDHNDLRLLPEIVTVYREFLEKAPLGDVAPAPAPTGDATPAPATPTPAVDADDTDERAALPSTGGGLVLAGLFAAAASLLRRRVCGWP